MMDNNNNISILSKLSMIQENLTKKEARLVDYIRENVNNLRDIKIEDLAKATGIGYSPIYSLISKLGFSGYRNFIIALGAEQEHLNSSNLKFEATEDIYNYYLDVIQRNNQIFDKDKMLATVNLLKKAHNIYIAGIGNTGLAAKELSNRLFRFGFMCNVLNEDEDSIKMRASLLHENDLLICMSLLGQTASVIEAAKEAKDNKASVVAITSKSNSELSKYADITHLIISSALYEKSEIFLSTLLPLIYWNDNLVQLLLSTDKDREYLDIRLKTNKIIKKYR